MREKLAIKNLIILEISDISICGKCNNLYSLEKNLTVISYTNDNSLQLK